MRPGEAEGLSGFGLVWASSIQPIRTFANPVAAGGYSSWREVVSKCGNIAAIFFKNNGKSLFSLLAFGGPGCGFFM